MGTLYLVSTPIGNLEDITLRAMKTLSSVDIILCEDTRRTGLLLQELHNRYSSSEESSTSREVNTDKEPRLIQFYEEIEGKKTPEIIEMLQNGKNIALVSDAGTPLISDPGFLLVREAIKRGISVTSIPGPSAILTALASSGLPAQPFMFFGYPPEKQSHRKQLFQLLIHNSPQPSLTKGGRLFSSPPLGKGRPGGVMGGIIVIFYCAPHKLQQTLIDMKEIFGDIGIVVARELTKIHEEFFRGTISEVESHFENPKGEFVLLFHIP